MHLNDDLPTLAELALAASTFLIDRAQTVAVAESAAGGLVSAALLAVPGASRYFLGGTVIYTRRAARGLLGLTAPEVAGLRGETEPYVQLLARTVRDRLGATWGLAESGAAGPKGSPYGDPPGRACLAVIGPATRIRTIETAASVRTENMDLFARHLLKEFVGLLSGHEAGAGH